MNAFIIGLKVMSYQITRGGRIKSIILFMDWILCGPTARQ